MTTLYLYFDGGTIHGSFMVFKNSVNKESLLEHRVYDMDGIDDSNQAEFTVLLRSIRWIQQEYKTEDYQIVIYGDNALVHKTVTMGLKDKTFTDAIQNREYRHLADNIIQRLGQFKQVEYLRVKRQIIAKMLGH